MDMAAVRWFGAILLVCLPLLSIAQGSAGGYGQGQGMGGGGFGGGGAAPGGFAGDRASDEKKARPDEDAEGWDAKTAILTPGDRVEFKLKVKKGEAVMAAANSDAFDPALSIEDAKGTVLIKNDDRAEGDQSPFIIYRFPEDGTYTLKVLSYRSVSGGKFVLRMRSFRPIDAGLGKLQHDAWPEVNPERDRRILFRISGKKGKYYDLRNASALHPEGASSAYFQRLVGPTGVEVTDFKAIPSPGNVPVFLALADGDYYAEYSINPARRYQTDFHEAAVIVAQPSGEHALEFAPGEMKVIECPIKKDQIVRSTLVGKDVTYTLSAPADTGRSGDDQEGDGSYGNNVYWLWFKPNVDVESDVIRVFHGEGIARFAVRSSSASVQKATFKNSESLPDWGAGVPVTGSLAVGENRFFLIRSTKSELMRTLATATHFQPRLDIFRLNGELANSLCDRKTHRAGDDLYFPDADAFIVRFSCDGNGGSGEFQMKRDELSPVVYALGSPLEMRLDGENFGFYSVNLEAGKRYELMTDNPQLQLRADLLDDEGQFLRSQGLRFETVEVQYFVPTRSGRHRLWLRGAAGTRHFKFGLHVQPKVGG